MRMRTSFDAWSAALLATLGLSTVEGCGGATVSTDGHKGSGAEPSKDGGRSTGASETGGRADATGGSDGSMGGSGAGGVAPVNPFPCNDPQPLGRGFDGCAGGFIHRRAPEDCPEPPSPGAACGAGSECHVDADCPGAGYTRCLVGTDP